MADTKITALTAITTVDPAADVLPIVDVSDTSMAASGTTKKITSNQILGAGGTATLASATITGALTVGNGTSATQTFNGVTNILDIGFGSLRGGSAYGDVRLWTDRFRIYNNAGTQIIKNISGTNGDETWYDGAGGTRMTLNSTGLGVGVAPELKLRVDGPDAAPATSGSSTTNGAFRIGAQGTGTNLCVDAGISTTGGTYGWFQARARNNYASNYDLVLNPNGGNVGIGVTPVTGGKLTVAGPIVRNKGNATLTQNVATTVATLPGEGLFIAYAYTNASNPSAFTSYAVILCDSVGSRVIANNGTQISITTSTFALQVTQIFAATLGVSWSFVQIG